MKKIKILCFLLLIVLFFTASNRKDDRKTIQVSGIEFISNFFSDNQKIVGIDAATTAEAMQKSGVILQKVNKKESKQVGSFSFQIEKLYSKTIVKASNNTYPIEFPLILGIITGTKQYESG